MDMEPLIEILPPATDQLWLKVGQIFYYLERKQKISFLSYRIRKGDKCIFYLIESKRAEIINNINDFTRDCLHDFIWTISDFYGQFCWFKNKIYISISSGKLWVSISNSPSCLSLTCHLNLLHNKINPSDVNFYPRKQLHIDLIKTSTNMGYNCDLGGRVWMSCK